MKAVLGENELLQREGAHALSLFLHVICTNFNANQCPQPLLPTGREDGLEQSQPGSHLGGESHAANQSLFLSEFVCGRMHKLQLIPSEVTPQVN